MNKITNNLLDYGKKALLGLSLLGLANCRTYAIRDYDKYPAHRGSIAFYNLEQILKDICYEPIFRIDFKIDEKGFYCNQGATSKLSFTWDEIEEARCEGRIVKITGKYEKEEIYTLGPAWQEHTKQCDDLAEAFKIYLAERRKK